MDDFGVLTQSMGIKPQGKAAPMKQSSIPFRKPDSKIHSFPNSPNVFDHVFGGAKVFSDNTFNYDAGDLFDEMPSLNNYGSHHFDDVFGSLSGNVSQNQTSSADDLFGSFQGDVSRNGYGGSAKASLAGFDNLIHGFSSTTAKTKGFNLNTRANQQTKKHTLSQSDDPFIMMESTTGDMSPDLLDQLGRLGTSRSTNLHHSSSSGSQYDNSDPFDLFNHADKVHSTRPASLSPPSGSSPPIPAKKAETVKNPSVFSIDELESFAMGKMQPTSTKKSDITKRKDVSHSPAAEFTAAWKEKQGSNVNRSRGAPQISRQKSENADFLSGVDSHSRTNTNKVADDAASQGSSHKSVDDLDYIFGTSRSNSVPRTRTTNLNTAFDNLFSNGVKHDDKRNVTSGTPSSSKNDSHHTNLVDDFSSLFGPGLAGDFKNIDGEPKERTKARMASHYRIQERMAQAVADMNKRDLQLQQEQEERQRIADSVDADIKRWAAGKEGNLRALLSSMQYVLWADCGWQSVSLTDLITSSSVKKVYKKATLCVHPDKVQQKGANLQQKYIAEKVFDILKEAHTKFNASELS